MPPVPHNTLFFCTLCEAYVTITARTLQDLPNIQAHVAACTGLSPAAATIANANHRKVSGGTTGGGIAT